MKETKYKTIKDLPSNVEGWDEHETIPVNTVCNVKYWEGANTIYYKDKFICDVDSKMAKEYFVELEDLNQEIEM